MQQTRQFKLFMCVRRTLYRIPYPQYGFLYVLYIYMNMARTSHYMDDVDR